MKADATFNPNVTVSDLDAEFTTTLSPASIKGTMKAASAPSRDLWQVEPSKLHVIEGFNVRVDTPAYRAHHRSIVESIKANGYYQDQPLAGYVAKLNGEAVIYITGGHTRLSAVKTAILEGAEIPRIPVVVSQDGVSMEDLTVSLISGNSGRALTYYESAVVCKRLVTYGFEVAEIAKRTGIAIALVKNRLSLMAAPLKLREMVANEVVSATLALEMIALHGANALQHLESAVERVEAAAPAPVAGAEPAKARVTKAKTDGDLRMRFVKKAAPKLFNAAESVRRDPGYTSLSTETRQLLEDLLAEITAKATPAAEQAI